MDDPKPLPCPFCGHGGGKPSPIVTRETGEGAYKQMQCGHCHAKGPYGKYRKGAVEAWNQRVKSDG